MGPRDLAPACRLTEIRDTIRGDSVDKLHAAWQELLAELAQRARTTWSALRPPSKSTQSVDVRLPAPLNDELRSWFGLHSGFDPWMAGQIFPFNTAVDLSTAVKDTLSRRRIWQANLLEEQDLEQLTGQPPGTVAHTWLDAYVALTQDGMGGGLFVDLRPGLLHGCVRWWDKVDADDLGVLATSVAALITDVSHSLRTGASVGGWVPHLVDGIIDWTPT
jgi:cell wall assembly regulator SMI1